MPTSKARLFVDAGLAEGALVDLSPGQAHYLGHVMRLGAGAPVAAFNGRDGEWRTRIESLGKGRGALAAEAQTRPQLPEPGPWLAFAPLKKTRTDFIAEKAAELGVERLWPVFTRRTASLRVNPGRLRAHAVEAAEQCGRLSVPEVAEPVDLERLIAQWPSARRLLVLDESGQGEPIAAALAALGRQAPCGFLAGPEGGWESGELDVIDKLPFASRVGLGSRTLRAETAALAALACWQATRGDW